MTMIMGLGLLFYITFGVIVLFYYKVHVDPRPQQDQAPAFGIRSLQVGAARAAARLVCWIHLGGLPKLEVPFGVLIIYGL